MLIITTIKKFIIVIFGTVILTTNSAVYAANPEINPNHPERYVVVAGDTLWEIAARFLNHPWQWLDLWKDNPHIVNPHLIYPGDVISLRTINGQTIADISRGGAVVKLSPKIRQTPLIEPIPTIPLSAIRPFLAQVRVTEPGELEQAPYLIGQIDNHLTSATGDYVYARGIISNHVNHYGIYRAGRPYYAQNENNTILLGIEAIPVGEAELKRFDDISTLLITKASSEIFAGDRLLTATPDSFDHNFMPHSPEHNIECHIIDVLGGLSRIGRFQTVVIDKGRLEGLEVGHVLTINQSSSIIKDAVTQENINLPEERAGLLMIFRVFEQLSYALILEAQREIKLYDVVRTP